MKTDQDFEKSIAELVAKGEDSSELKFWQGIFPSLDADHQRELFENLQQELENLKK